MSEFRLFTDARLKSTNYNTRRGAAGLGFVVLNSSGNPLIEDHGFVLDATVNQAELGAILLGLEQFALRMPFPETREVTAYSDSRLSIGAITGNWNVTDHELNAIVLHIHRAAGEFARVEYKTIHHGTSAIRRAQTLAEKALKEKGFIIKHRGTKGAKRRPRSGKFWDPYYPEEGLQDLPGGER